MPEKPPTKQELQRRESLKQYVLGLLYLREDRLLDAVKSLEKALELDPAYKPAQSVLLRSVTQPSSGSHTAQKT